ncbi:hypothetical protein EES43_16135 [Streptomyces sp. ADI96-02]|nr:hypothetical protein EES43_16135 [Streptomyces sp. ADI96-02]
MPEPLDGLLLVGPQGPAVLGQLDRVRLAVDVPGEILGGPAELQQGLLDLPALGGVHGHGVRVDPGADQRLHLLRPQDLLQHGPVGGGEHEPVHGVLGQGEPPVPRHRLGDVDQEGVRHGVAGVLDERVDDLLGVVPGGAGVPQPERGDPVGVDVLGRTLQLGEGRDDTTAGVRQLVVDFEEQRLVALDDEGSGHALRPFLRGATADAAKRPVCRIGARSGQGRGRSRPGRPRTGPARRACQRTGCPMPSRFPSLSWNQAPRSPRAPLLG